MTLRWYHGPPLWGCLRAFPRFRHPIPCVGTYPLLQRNLQLVRDTPAEYWTQIHVLHFRFFVMAFMFRLLMAGWCHMFSDIPPSTDAPICPPLCHGVGHLPVTLRRSCCVLACPCWFPLSTISPGTPAFCALYLPPFPLPTRLSSPPPKRKIKSRATLFPW